MNEMPEPAQSLEQLPMNGAVEAAKRGKHKADPELRDWDWHGRGKRHKAHLEMCNFVVQGDEKANNVKGGKAEGNPGRREGSEEGFKAEMSRRVLSLEKQWELLQQMLEKGKEDRMGMGMGMGTGMGTGTGTGTGTGRGGERSKGRPREREGSEMVTT